MITLFYSPTLTTIDGLTLDACIEEEPKYVTEVTDHPVERGLPVADSARPKPLELTIKGVITNAPLDQTRASSGTDFAAAAHAQLAAMMQSPRLVVVASTFGQYPDMVPTEYDPKRTSKTGDALDFTMKFKHVSQVSIATTVVATKTTGGKGKAKLGTKPTTPGPNPNNSNRMQAALAAIKAGAK